MSQATTALFTNFKADIMGDPLKVRRALRDLLSVPLPNISLPNLLDSVFARFKFFRGQFSEHLWVFAWFGYSAVYRFSVIFQGPGAFRG
jgi:hypothetical protein